MHKRHEADQVLTGPVITQVRDLDADGHRWRIHEVLAPSFDRRSGTHLVFHADTVIRRVRNFPANWYELSDDELYVLTDQAKRAKRA